MEIIRNQSQDADEAPGRAQVVIIYRNPLFARGVASLLRRDGALDVIDFPADGAATRDRLEHLAPAVVILEGSDGNDPEALIAPLADSPWVIRIRLEGNAVDIRRHTVITASQPLVDVVSCLARQATPSPERRYR